MACDEGCRGHPAKANEVQQSDTRGDDPNLWANPSRSDDPNLLCWPPRVSHLVAVVAAVIALFCVVARQWPLMGVLALVVMLLAVDPGRLTALRALLPGGTEIQASLEPAIDRATTVRARRRDTVARDQTGNRV